MCVEKGGNKMKQVLSIGEALIDWIPAQRDCLLKEVEQFTRICGGAPANVAAVVARLGGDSRMITQLGEDAFGDYIVEVLVQAGVDVSCISRTKKANTAMAFVSLKADGNREFSFYRSPSADMLLEAAQIQPAWFATGGILHFCSVSLIDAPIRTAHRVAIDYAKQAGVLISFDPNIRLALWDDPAACREQVLAFLPSADIVKLSDEELEFVTGEADIHAAAAHLFEIGCRVILYSMGKDGAMLLTPKGSYTAANVSVPVKDTTGAGDAIIGALLYCLAAHDVTALETVSAESWQKWLEFAVYYANYSVMGSGAIASYPERTAFLAWMQEKKAQN